VYRGHGPHVVALLTELDKLSNKMVELDMATIDKKLTR
jgi:hypothetical protein